MLLQIYFLPSQDVVQTCKQILEGTNTDQHLLQRRAPIQ